MVFADPLKTLDKLWDKIEKANIPKWLKAILLTLVTLAVIVYCFGWLFIVKQMTDLIAYLLHVS